MMIMIMIMIRVKNTSFMILLFTKDNSDIKGSWWCYLEGICTKIIMVRLLIDFVVDVRSNGRLFT